MKRTHETNRHTRIVISDRASNYNNLHGSCTLKGDRGLYICKNVHFVQLQWIKLYIDIFQLKKE